MSGTMSQAREPKAGSNAARTSHLAGLLRLIRLHHGTKNLFVLAPLLFSGEFHQRAPVIRALLAMGMFIIASSAVYAFNDLLDLPGDRRHPVKRSTRPLATGEVSPRAAWAVLGFLLLLLGVAVFLEPRVGVVVLGYVVLNVLYTLRLKRIPVLDLFCIASGFVLRIFAGAVALWIPLSTWMLTTTLSLALFLAATKRRTELLHSSDGRLVLRSYTPALLERYAQVAAASSIVFYSLFIMAVRPWMVETIPIVLFGLFRYWYIVETTTDGENPTEVVIHDWPLMVTVVGWVALCAFSI
jgi:decaprenyl-phosphate phosphoribosyltransferase